MRMYLYVVARDYGFAPNPFFGVCTLATCKPGIRKGASIGDYVIGTGRVPNRWRMVYWMRVEEATTYDEYWVDMRYRRKRPCFCGSLKQAYGDNIYRRQVPSGEWLQAASHHSFPDGKPNPVNVVHDTQVSRVLIGREFGYWGGTGPEIPEDLRGMCAVRGYRCNFAESKKARFLDWILTQDHHGCVGSPMDW